MGSVVVAGIVCAMGPRCGHPTVSVLNGFHLGRDVGTFVWFRSLVIVAEKSSRVVRDFQRTPPVPLPADARLRSWLAGDYGGYDEPLPHAPTVPATLVTPLAVDVSGWPSRPPAFVNGPSGTYTRPEGPCAPALAVLLAPLGAYKLLGPAVSEIGGTIVGLEDIVGAKGRRLSEQVRSAPTWEERGRLLDDFLLDRATQGPQPSPEVTHAWHLLARSCGRDPISEIARQVGWSHKHLITKFKQQIGVAPHLAARLLRLSTVWRHLNDDQTWARIAAECGYADQAHLTREFRRFTGTTPAALIAA
jgi:AraC-like DNA-binding protein